jgi:predicted esterase
MARLLTLALLGPALLGCTEADGPEVFYEPNGDGMFDSPWPSDTRLDPDGTPDLSAFPNPSDSDLIQDYLQVADVHVGFGNNTPVYFRLRGPVDTDLLPSPAASVETGSSLVFLDVDPHSPFFGERFPVVWDFQEGETKHQPANLLAVLPLWGFPLRPVTTYAALLTTDLAARNETFAEVWDDEHEDHALYVDLEEALFLQGLSKEDVAVATVFTTGDPVEEMARVVRFLENNVEPAILDQQVRKIDETLHFKLYEGHYPGPVFQHGSRPYATEGGGLLFREDGMPLIHSWDEMRLALSTPKDLSAAPASGWPVVIYQHGTGGDYRSFAGGASAMEPAAQFAHADMVGIGIDQPLHGTRGGQGGEVDFLFFNIFNPDAGRTNFRQAGLDAVYLAQSLRLGATFETSHGTEIPIDPDRIFFMGHSQGAISGAVALPWLSAHVDAAVISSAGGGLAITIVERKDPIDFAGLIAEVLDFDGDEDVNEFHPVVALIQWLVEVTDPMNYAPYWYSEQGGWADHKPLSVVCFSGLEDIMTPYRTAEAMAAAARMPLLAPGVTSPDSLTLRGLPPQEGPLATNVPAFDGQVTAALTQWDGASHWVIFEDRNAARIYREFLRTAAEGEPTINRYP